MLFLEKLRLPFREDTAFSFITLCIFLVPLAFSLYSYENFESVKFSLFLVCTGAAALSFFITFSIRGNKLRANKYINWLAGGFGFWALLSTVFAGDHIYAFFGSYYRYTSGAIFYLTLFLFFWLLINLADKEKFIFLLKVLVFDALLVGLVACLESFGWIVYQGLNSTGFFRGPSLLGNINYSAMFMVCILPLAIYFFVQARIFSSRIYYGLVIFFILISSIILASRGAILAMAFSIVTALILLVVFKFPKKFWFGLLIPSAFVVIAGVSILGVSRPGAIGGIFNKADVNTATRLYAWRVSIDEIRKHPLLGSGPGNFAIFFERQRPFQSANQVGIFDDAHNLFLQLAATGGIPLLIFFIGLLAASFYYGIKELFKKPDLLEIALLSGISGWLVAVSFNPVPIPMFLLLAVFLAAVLFNHTSVRGVDWKIWKKILAILLSLMFLFWGLISLTSEHLLGLSLRAYSLQSYDWSYRLSKAAYTINPTNGLFLIYKASSLAQLGGDPALVVVSIQALKHLHPYQANSYVSASNLYFLLYTKFKDPKFLAAAADEMRNALRLDPLFSDRWGQLGLYEYQQKDLANAKLDTQHDISLNNKDFYAWILLAKLYQLEGNRHNVILALTQAFYLNPGLLQLKYILNLAKQLPDIRQLPLNISPQQPRIQ